MDKIKFKKKKYLTCHLRRCFESPSKDPSWLVFRELVTSADKLARLLSPMLPGVWQVKTPELWNSLKFHGNMWTPICFSALAGRMESCEDATLSSELGGQWVERERGDGRQMLEKRIKQETDQSAVRADVGGTPRRLG